MDFDSIMAVFEIIERLATDYIVYRTLKRMAKAHIAKHPEITQKTDAVINTAKEKNPRHFQTRISQLDIIAMIIGRRKDGSSADLFEV